MALCAGISFKRVARSYWFDPAGLELRENDRVIVETARGPEPGIVKVLPREVPEDEIQAPLKRILRLAVDADAVQEQKNRELARKAVQICNDSVQKLNLPMRLLQAEYSFDGSQVTIYFTAETRVDFRELVREVAGCLRCKVQMHQVGARDQARMIGGVGPCGLTLCCATFLSDFAPISMKMAKDQSLFLNPVKFSGVCGKLMCCLKYEHESDEEPIHAPQIGDIVRTDSGQGKILDIDLALMRAHVRLLDGGEEIFTPVAELKPEKTTRCTNCNGCSVEQLHADAREAVSGQHP
jgi:cell fate regulator YaaT (PSP1 superfamily)